jgi:hypothetical protein
MKASKNPAFVSECGVLGVPFRTCTLARTSAANKYKSKYDNRPERHAQMRARRPDPVDFEGLGAGVALRHDLTVTEARRACQVFFTVVSDATFPGIVWTSGWLFGQAQP